MMIKANKACHPSFADPVLPRQATSQMQGVVPQGVLSHGILHAIWKVVLSFITYRVMKSAEAQLRHLDDRMLKDIGLHRSEIESMLRDLSQDCRNSSRIRRTPTPDISRTAAD